MNPYPIERRAANRLPMAAPPGDAFGIRGALDTVLQHGRLAFTVLALTFAAALLYQLLTAPVYRADTVLEIDTRARSSLLPTLSVQVPWPVPMLTTPETWMPLPPGDVTVVKFTPAVPFGLSVTCPVALPRVEAPHWSSWPSSAKPVGVTVRVSVTTLQ